MRDTASQTAALLALLDRFDVAEFDYRDATRHIRVTGGRPAKASVPAISAPLSHPTADATSRQAIASPGVGRFKAANRDGLPRAVSKGEVLGTLSTGLVLMPVVSPNDAVLLAIRHEDGMGVGYGTLLFDIDTSRG